MPSPTRPFRLSEKMKSHCRELRHDSTVPERILWGLLRNRRLAGMKFRRQQTIGPFIVDFYCADMKLVIEVDGESHSGRLGEDQKRQSFLERNGLRVIRFTNEDVLGNLEGVGLEILRCTGQSECDSCLPCEDEELGNIE